MFNLIYNFAVVLALSYQVDPTAATLPIPERRAVVISGTGAGTNKPLARLVEAGDTVDVLLGITNAGAEEAERGDFPEAAETHISVVEQGRYIIEVKAGETITAATKIAVDVDGVAAALGAGEFDTDWVAVDDSLPSTAQRPSYIRVNLNK